MDLGADAQARQDADRAARGGLLGQQPAGKFGARIGVVGAGALADQGHGRAAHLEPRPLPARGRLHVQHLTGLGRALEQDREIAASAPALPIEIDQQGNKIIQMGRPAQGTGAVARRDRRADQSRPLPRRLMCEAHFRFLPAPDHVAGLFMFCAGSSAKPPTPWPARAPLAATADQAW